MSKVLGIISEYNPFHNGHFYHLKKSKEICNADYTICVISGNFTQRGSTSIVDKWSKTRMALSNGVDLVIELPILYSISSAENFATGAIKILDSLKIVDNISFGSETSDINILNKFANILYDEPQDFKNILANELDKGFSFPKARAIALTHYLANSDEDVEILNLPNNILGIEYLKALKKQHSNIKPICIPRFKANYNSSSFSGNIASATAIRNLIKNNNFNTIKELVPISTYSILEENIKNNSIIPDLNIFEKEIIYILRRLSIEEITELPDVSEGLEFSIKNAVNSCNGISELLNILKSKRYTITRLQRILLYALLGITKNDISASKEITPYVRVLGFNDNGRDLISKISKNNPNLKIITSVKKFVDENKDKNLKMMLEKDIFATDVYTIGFKNKSLSNLDYTHNIIKY